MRYLSVCSGIEAATVAWHPLGSAQLDHILPKARGGDDSAGNLRWTCEAVNIAKRHMTDDEFLTLCGEVMAWIGRRIQMVDELA